MAFMKKYIGFYAYSIPDIQTEHGEILLRFTGMNLTAWLEK